MNKIGRLDAVTHEWSKAGELKNGRFGHGVVSAGSTFLVVGGEAKSFKTEKCVLQGKVMTCTEQESPALDGYSFPEIFLTTENYSC